METSTECSKIFTALAKAQAAAEYLGKDKTLKTPQFSFDYATLANSIAAIRKAFTDNGIAVVQCPSLADGVVTVTTRLCHSSGEWIQSALSMPTGRKPQEVGSAITYARRYALQAMAGIAPDDDDGAAAQKGHGEYVQPKQRAAPTSQPNIARDTARIAAKQVMDKSGMSQGDVATCAAMPGVPHDEYSYNDWGRLEKWCLQYLANERDEDHAADIADEARKSDEGMG